MSRTASLSFLGRVSPRSGWCRGPRRLLLASVRVEVSTRSGSPSRRICPLSHGRRLVRGAPLTARAWLRSLDAGEARPLPGTEVARARPRAADVRMNSRFVAFDATGRLKKVDVTGGDPQTVCDLLSLAVGGSWNRTVSLSWAAPRAASSVVRRRVERRPLSRSQMLRASSRHTCFRGSSQTVGGSST